MNRNVHIYFSEMRNESRIFKIVATLIKNRVFDEIFVVGRVGKNLPERELLHDGVTILRIDAPLFSLLVKVSAMRVALWYVATLIQLVRLAPHCLSVHSVSLLPMALAVKVMRPGLKIIYETHELETETNGASQNKKRMRSWLERLVMPAVSQTVTVSPSICNWYAARYRNNEVSLVMNCPQFHPRQDSDYLRQHFSFAADTVIFLYQGIMFPGRGIEKLVEAFERLPKSAVLVLLGYGPDFDKWYAVSQGSERIFVHTAVPVDRVLSLTASADCGISFFEDTCLSHRFALPNKLFEFIQARLPVIVSPTTDQSQLVMDMQIGLVCESFEVNAVVKACESFLNNPPEKIDARLDLAASLHSWEMQEERVLRVYAAKAR
ncbi:glycosyltransferase [Luminiphilus sp.]|nr:glycosyltransferase [Luminiphilus sp.]